MSQPTSASKRSFPGMVGAMLVLVLLVVGGTLLRSALSGDQTTQVQTVDWNPWVKAGRADRQIPLMAPAALPSGWRATSAKYTSGFAPHWHLGMLTAKGEYVGLDESRDPLDSLVTQFVDVDAKPGKDVQIGDQTWQTWTDSGGDYAVGRVNRVGNTALSSYLVVGTAPPAQIRDFAASLKGGSVRTAG